jgi:hypothetical protein
MDHQRKQKAASRGDQSVSEQACPIDPGGCQRETRIAEQYKRDAAREAAIKTIRPAGESDPIHPTEHNY